MTYSTVLYGSLLGNIPRVWPLNNLKYDPVFILVCPHTLIVWPSGATDNRKDPLTQLDDEDMSPEDETIRMVIPDGFRLQESRPAALDNSLAKREVLD